MSRKKRGLFFGVLTVLFGMLLFFQWWLIREFNKAPGRVEILFRVPFAKPEVAKEAMDVMGGTYKIHRETLLEDALRAKGERWTVEAPAGKEDPFFARKFLEDWFLHVGFLEKEEYEVRDYTAAPRRLWQFLTGYVFFLECLGFLGLLLFGAREGKAFLHGLKDSLAQKYLKELVQEQLSELLMEAIKWTLLIFIGLFLLRRIQAYSLDVSMVDASGDSLWSAEAVWQVFSWNCPARWEPSAYEVLYQRTRFLCTVNALVLLLMTTACFWAFVRKMRSKKG